ncbi:NAD(P)-binding protein [Atractiella rhizophila]|nr:NAD(P)-binding protein [Atractiella rhizophila]
MSLIRVGFVGLSAGGGWGSQAHLPYLQKSTKYAIRGLLNSTPESAKAAIQAFSLPTDAKIYSSPQELADDPDIDLVVISVNVAQHYELVLPSLKNGKKAFVEWPLGKTLEEAEALVAVARSSGIATSAFMGLQGRFNPVVGKAKQLVENGEVGKILSTTLNGVVPLHGPTAAMPKIYYHIMEEDSGANFRRVHTGHMIDTFCFVLGEWDKYTSVAKNRRSFFRHADTGDTAPKTAIDHVFIQGILKSGVVASVAFLGADIAPGTPALVWRIQGENGEIEITSESDAILGNAGDAKIRVIKERQAVEVPVDLEIFGFQGTQAHIAAEYEEYASGGTRLANFEVALERHKFLREIVEKSL